MHDPCRYCPIRVNCDYLSGMCRLSPLEVAQFRPDLITREGQRKDHILKLAAQNEAVFTATRERRVRTARLGFRKYDKRVKDSRGYWRGTAV